MGTAYEKMAGEYLKTQGYEILQYNFRCRMGEIDIIAKDHGYLVFIEVKYRRNAAYGTPAEAVNLRKQQKICKVADYYRMKHRVSDGQACRFDVVAIQGRNIRLIRDAFPYCFY